MEVSRRELIKAALGTAVAISSIPSLGIESPSPTSPGVLFVDITAIDTREMIEALKHIPAFHGWWVVAVIPQGGRSVRDCVCTSRDIEDVHALELNEPWKPRPTFEEQLATDIYNLGK